MSEAPVAAPRGREKQAPSETPSTAAAAREALRSVLSRSRAADSHGVEIIDTPAVRVHHPSDLVTLVIAAVGVALILLLAVYAHGTTTGVTQDVRGFSVLLNQVLFEPVVTVLEGLITVAVPAAVLIELAVRRLGRQLLEAVAASILGLLVGVITIWVIRTWGSDDLVGALSVWVDGASVVVIPGYVSAIAALLTGSGTRARRRTVAWSWNLLWIALGVVLITGQVSLPGAAIALLFGRMAGLAVRYVAGTSSERAYGADLVHGIRRAGFAPVRLTRVSEAPGERLPHEAGDTGHEAAAALARYGDNRVYLMETEAGARLDVVVLDGDRQVVGVLARLWRSLRLRGIDGRAVVSLRQATERAALLSYAARAAGVRTPRLLAIAEAEDSMLLVQQHVTSAVPLRGMPADEITDEVLAVAWHQLGLAHAAGIAHRSLTSDVVLLGGTKATPEVWLTGWEYGDVASSDLARRMDLTQMVALLALRVGARRALTSAVGVLPAADIAAIGPLLQTVALPRSTREEVREHRDVLADLRTALVEQLPEADVEPERLVRFGARTVLTLALTTVAVSVIVTRMNLDQITTAFNGAEKWWALVAFALGILTWVGAGLTLLALSPVRLPVMRTILVQVAGSFVAIATPAGVGPAALNLRLLTRRGISKSLSAATVALVQVSQFFVTIVILAALSIVSGDGGALRDLPSTTVLLALAFGALALALVLLIPAARGWIAKKTLPMLRQTWPRLIEVLGQPGRLALAIGGNVIMTMGYVFAFDASLSAFGYSLPPLDIAVIYLIGNALGAAVPTPGGLGAVEFALITGLTTSGGVPPAIATSVVVVFRALTYWGRIPIGWVAMRYLQRKGEL